MPKRTSTVKKPGLAATILVRLRERTGLSIQEMADELGWHPRSKYQYYEDRYTRDDLPSDKFFEIKGVLMKRGVPEGEINRLLHKGIYEELAKLRAEVGSIRRALGKLLEHEEAIPGEDSSPDDLRRN